MFEKDCVYLQFDTNILEAFSFDFGRYRQGTAHSTRVGKLNGGH